MAATSRAVGAVSPEWRDNEIEQRGSGKDDALHADGGLGWVGSRWDLVAPTSRFQLHPMSLMRSIQTHPNQPTQPHPSHSHIPPPKIPPPEIPPPEIPPPEIPPPEIPPPEIPPAAPCAILGAAHPARAALVAR